MRGIAVGRRNWTFAGSDCGGARAAVYTLIETAKLTMSIRSLAGARAPPSCAASTTTHPPARTAALDLARRSPARRRHLMPTPAAFFTALDRWLADYKATDLHSGVRSAMRSLTM